MARIPTARSRRRTLLLAALLAGAAIAHPSAPTSDSPTAEEIIRQLQTHNQTREQLLAGYQVTRRYHLKNELTEKEATLEVEVTFSPPDKLDFSIRNQAGSGFLARQVFGRMMKGEQESLEPAHKRRSALAAENYEFHLRGQEPLSGRLAYKLEVTPRREDTYLFQGTVWVDAEDFAVVRAEGNPIKRPSFWTRKIDFVRTFRKVGAFWLPDRTESVTEVLLFGTSWTTIESADYRLRLRTPERE